MAPRSCDAEAGCAAALDAAWAAADAAEASRRTQAEALRGRRVGSGWGLAEGKEEHMPCACYDGCLTRWPERYGVGGGGGFAGGCGGRNEGEGEGCFCHSLAVVDGAAGWDEVEAAWSRQIEVH